VRSRRGEDVRADACPDEARAPGWRRVTADAGGEIPREDFRRKATDAIGRPVGEWLAAKRAGRK
jgi:hypothetical protein